ncbi:uncharacterized protein LOC120084987 [Benincasa hispida]|uniref:uncharacterized protein LOC120084987 n=1 Tax=Benincasa hispida TaxID=102211 RepID=UPI00190225D8|nr:uncharacterized protein LOC120084987 [Benincasa hispida]
MLILGIKTEFETSDKGFLKVATMKGVLRFGRKGKLSPRFIRPYEILERIGPVAYRLATPPSLSTLNENLSYEERPTRILAREMKTLRNRDIALVKISWQNHQFKEAT